MKYNTCQCAVNQQIKPLYGNLGGESAAGYIHTAMAWNGELLIIDAIRIVWLLLLYVIFDYA